MLPNRCRSNRTVPATNQIRVPPYDLIIKESVRIAGSACARTTHRAMQPCSPTGEQTAGIAHSWKQLIEDCAGADRAPHVDLGVAYLNAGRWAEATRRKRVSRHALVLTPEHPVAANELGLVYRHTGRFALKRGESFETCAREAFPNYHIAQKNLGVLCDVFLTDLQLCAGKLPRLSGGRFLMSVK